jgi:hypothetical protein
MRKAFVSSSVAGLSVLVSAVFLVAVAGAPDVITIDDCQSKQAAVEFPHKAHLGLTECVTCHHTSEGLTADSDMAVEKCGSCHLEPEADTTPKCSEMSTSKNPYHKGCIGCHKDAVKADEASKAPVKCADCHPKG